MIWAVAFLVRCGLRRLLLGPPGLPWGVYPERPMPERDPDWYRKVWQGTGIG